ncbi:MAG: SBBP repeat-containing protein, partial [Anaerolineales bacterium]|nr:SBBP repeat-containing protein [Anaerolineales bacterium]
YIYAAEQLLFLAGYFIWRVTSLEWSVSKYRLGFLSGLIAMLISALVAVELYINSQSLSQVQLTMVIILGIIGLSSGIASVFALVRGIGWAGIRAERSFDLLILLSSLILPLLAALPVKIAGFNPLDYNSEGIIRSAGVIVLLAILAAGLGLWWNRRVWLTLAVIFYTIFILFFSTFFTNAIGVAGGFMGALGYWLEQQFVSRGDQPWYFYALLQVPVYEFLPALGALLAVLIAWRKRLWWAQPGQPFEPGHIQENTSPQQSVPTLALLAYWSLSSLVVFSIAGEKMPWLTVNITMPLILTSAWGVGYLIETYYRHNGNQQPGWLMFLLLLVFLPALGELLATLAKRPSLALSDDLVQMGNISTLALSTLAIIASGWGLIKLLKNWGFSQFLRSFILICFAFLAVLTARTAYRAAYVNYDYPYEYLVYAHAAPDPKRLLTEIEKISQFTNEGTNLVVAYDNNVRYPYWWYMRYYPNRIDFDINPTRDLRRAAVIFASEENYGKLAPIIRQDYIEYNYMRLWWPNQDYWRLKWDQIDAERQQNLTPEAIQALPAMSLGDYLMRTWGHIRPFFVDPQVRNAIIQIWLNRDYRQYAGLQNSPSFTLTEWSPASKLRMYIRKDIAAQVGYCGTLSQEAAKIEDPYEKVAVQINSDRVLGGNGTNPGQFQAPRGIAVAPDGSLYVADSGNHRIQHLNPDGQVLQAWGSFADRSKGEAPGGTFYEPWGVAVAPDGAVYVTDTWNHRVQKFTSDGKLLLMWGYFGQAESPEAFWGPRGIAVDSNGQVFVIDTGNKRVVVFDPQGQFITQFGQAGMEQGQMDEPVGIALDENGNVYITDTWNQRVQVFSPDEPRLTYTPTTTWDIAGWFGESLDNKPFIAVDTQQHVYITDPEACRVLEFSSVGEILRVWGNCSPEPGGFDLPTGLALDSNAGLWVSDAGYHQLFHFPLY